MFVYLDNSATTKQYREVNQAMIYAMEQNFGNPSSLHGLGLGAEKKVKEARKIFAASLSAKEDEVYFTSGGTEADNTVIFGISEAKKRMGNKIITTRVEPVSYTHLFASVYRQFTDVNTFVKEIEKLIGNN